MKHPGTRWRVAALSIVFTTATAAAFGAAPAREVVDRAFLDKYCTSCHNQDEWRGGLALDYADLSHVGAEAAMWESVVNKMRTGMMPPYGEPRPAPRQLDAFAAGLERELDRNAAGNPQAGTPGLRRLTRFEYGNAIRDLLALQADVATLLPPDNNSDGFDTNGDTLGNSPSLVEAYVNAASKLARRAVGDRHIALKQVDYRPPVGWSQRKRIDGLPFNSRGGFSFEREFPLDGEYEFVVTPAIGPLFARGLPRGASMYLAVDGKAVPAAPVVPAPPTPAGVQPQPGGGAAPGQKFRMHVKAGLHKVSATLIEQVRVTGTDDIYSIDKRHRRDRHGLRDRAAAAHRRRRYARAPQGVHLPAGTGRRRRGLRAPHPRESCDARLSATARARAMRQSKRCWGSTARRALRAVISTMASSRRWRAC